MIVDNSCPIVTHSSKLTPSCPSQIIAPLLRVMEKCHSLRLMHRDIKPENIFLTRGGKLRLGDFGLAINFTQEVPFSRSGTLDYMAPEVGAGWKVACGGGPS